MGRYTLTINGPDGPFIIPQPVSVTFRKTENMGQSFSAALLKEDDTLAQLVLGRQVILNRNGVEKTAGYISKRNLTGSPVTIDCLSNETLLSRMVCPRDWKIKEQDLADVARDLLMGWDVRTFNTQAQWQAAALTNIDTTTVPGKAMLSKTVQGAYQLHGTLRLVIDFGQTVERFEALRWSEDAGEQTRVRAQFETSPDGVTWSAISEELSSVYPDTDGVWLSGQGRYLRITMHLYTDNNYEPNPSGVAQGYTPILNGLEVIARVTPKTVITAGNIPASTGVTVKGFEFSRTNHLRILQDLCEEYKYIFAVNGDLQLSLGETLGQDKSDAITFMRTQNMNLQTFNDSADAIENVVLCLGSGSGSAQLQVTLRDESSIAAYGGERPGIFEDSSCETIEALTEKGQEYLNSVSKPAGEYVVAEVPVWELPEDVGCGDTVTVFDPIYEVLTTARITDEQRTYDRSGEKVSFGLNHSLDNIIEQIIRRVAVSRTPARDTALSAPGDITIKPGYQAIAISWTGCPGADSYVLEHSADGQAWSTLARPTERSYYHGSLAVGSTHYYRVRAVRNNVVSEASEAVSATLASIPAEDVARDTEAPAKPVGLAAVASLEAVRGGGSQLHVELSWTANTEDDLREYLVRRSEDGGATWITLAPVTRSAAKAQDYNGIKETTTYQYQVAAVDTSDNISAWSDAKSVLTPSNTTPPAVPANLKVSGALKKIIASWQGSGAVDLDGFEVYASTQPGFVPDTINKTNMVYRGRAEVCSFDGAASVTYYVRVRAYTTSNVYSEPCAEQSAQCAQLDVEHDIADAAIDLATKVRGLLSNANLAQITDPALLAAEIIKAGMLAPGSIDKAELIVGEVIAAAHLAAGAVTAEKIAANAVTAGTIDAEAVTAREIKGETITGDKLVADTITGDKIKAKEITGAHIDVDTLTANSISTEVLTLSNAVIIPTNGDVFHTPMAIQLLYNSNPGGIVLGGLEAVGKYASVGTYKYKPYVKREEYYAKNGEMKYLSIWSIFAYIAEFTVSFTSPRVDYYTHQPSPAPAVGTSVSNGFGGRLRIRNDTTGAIWTVLEYETTSDSSITDLGARLRCDSMVGITPDGDYTALLEIKPLNVGNLDIKTMVSQGCSVDIKCNDISIIVPTD
jgi:hypothetical protein